MKPDLPSHRQFFGDAPRSFTLTTPMIVELERVCGTGIGSLSRRLFQGQFAHHELLAVLRLGLIGAGERPEVAASLVSTYAEPLPITDLYLIALPVLETRMFGGKTKKKGRGK